MNSPKSRVSAQQRTDDLHTFLRELALLQENGILVLTETQKQAVQLHSQKTLADLAREFDVDSDRRSKQLTLGMRVASFLGAIALAASVFFLFHQFWGLLGTLVQLLILIGAAVATWVATLLLRVRDGSGYFTKLAALVAFACFVLNVAMLGSIFNITPSDNALVVWAAYAILLAYACDLRLLLVAGLLCGMAFIAARAGEWGGIYWLDFGERPENFFPAALAAFVLPSLFPQERFGGFAATYRVFGLLAIFLPVLVLAHYGRISYLHWDPRTIEHAYQVLGFVVTAALVWVGVRRDWPETVNTSVTFFVIFLYTKFYDWWWQSFPKYLFFLLLGLTALLALSILRRWRATQSERRVGVSE